jgi:hypothetical protein
MALKILHLGPLNGTCLDRANAMRRLGHAVDQVDLRRLLSRTVWVDRVTWRFGGEWFAPWVVSRLSNYLADRHYDLCIVESSEWVTSRVIALLHRHSTRVINYSIDDPLGARDGPRFLAYRRSLRSYDLCVVMRPCNVAEARARGARDVLRVFMTADEITHAPRLLSAEERRNWESDVLFLGTWFPERGAILKDLIVRGVPLTLRGAEWDKAPEWPTLRPHWKGGEIRGDEYAKAIQCAKVCIGLVSRGNRDMHTTRSSEIPALGSLLCAERTADHLEMYEEGNEALFWNDADECAAMCRSALEDEGRRQAIAAAGHARVGLNGCYNEAVLQKIISRAMTPRA